ncbi:6-phosphogluconolactonase [Lysinibacter sp. HNR]|uniref:6-phosphogluconolactonase n=1 Tax=Lysinibacter sp. HNR TaxID=3031408 RepID=UPI002434AEBA|nr:6-phosphogluconolactonase [Lysinibacter sp. HNR]WGD37518.1 6-phosphogluconolactonase [Lysinibacter sp. HNR]
MTQNPYIFATDDDLGHHLAGQIADLMHDAEREGRGFVLGCPGGRTPRSTYAHLAAEVRDRGLSLDRVIIAMMDDYVIPDGDSWQHVPADVHYSCRRFARVEIQEVLNAGARAASARGALASAGGAQVAAGGVLASAMSEVRASAISDDRVWFPNPAAPAEYDRRLADAGGIDFFLLASGAGDGHVAFNPPGSARDSQTRVVELAEQTRIDNLATFPDYGSLDDVPTHGVTVGIGTIASLSKRAAMIAQGEGKRAAVARLSAATGYDPEWPATVYREIAHAGLYVDSAAISSSPPHP